MAKIWAEREKKIERVLLNTAGLYGDLQGTTGNTLQPINQLELPVVIAEDKKNESKQPVLVDRSEAD